MSEYTAYREGYSDGFNDGVEFMQKQFVKNCEEAKKRQAERFSEWREACRKAEKEESHGRTNQ